MHGNAQWAVAGVGVDGMDVGDLDDGEQGYEDEAHNGHPRQHSGRRTPVPVCKFLQSLQLAFPWIKGTRNLWSHLCKFDVRHRA